MRQLDPPAFIVKQMTEALFDGAPRTFEYAGRNFAVHNEVFSPLQFRSTRIFTNNLQFAPGRSFFEIGCGAGVTAIVAALSGCDPVVASDISIAAVENARANARAHGVDDIVSVRHGDLFDVVKPGERFDTIYWNSNFVYVSADYAYPDDLHRAFFDAGYACHTRYLQEAPRHLAPGGSLLLGFSTLGDEQSLRELCSEHGYEITTLASEVSDAEGHPRYDILKLTKIASSNPATR